MMDADLAAADISAPQPELISLENCCLDYDGKIVLRGMSLSIRAGEKIALIGKSGSGKSTLLKHLRTRLGKKTAWCPQVLGLVPMFSVYHNIYMGGLERFNIFRNLSNLLVPNRKAKTEIIKIADSLQLSDLLWTSVDQLSGGQQQRTAIGRALFQRRDTLLADEPVSALDDFQSQHILQSLIQGHDTIVLALHDVAVAQAMCDRIIALDSGRISFDCASDQLDSDRLSQLYNNN